MLFALAVTHLIQIGPPSAVPLSFDLKYCTHYETVNVITRALQLW